MLYIGSERQPVTLFVYHVRACIISNSGWQWKCFTASLSRHRHSRALVASGYDFCRPMTCGASWRLNNMYTVFGKYFLLYIRTFWRLIRDFNVWHWTCIALYMYTDIVCKVVVYAWYTLLVFMGRVHGSRPVHTARGHGRHFWTPGYRDRQALLLMTP